MEMTIEKLFAKPICVKFKDGNVIHSRPEKPFLTIEWQDSTDTVRNRKLLFTLTDIDDPFFLYILQLSEADFQIIKNTKNIHVDFSCFPQNVIQFVELSLNEVPQRHTLVWDVGENNANVSPTAHLEVVKTSDFISVTMLSLKFLQATEPVVKKHLATRLRNLKDDKEALQNKLCFLEKDSYEKLSTYKEKLEKKCQELEIIKKELSVELSMKESKHARELMEERDKFITKHREDETRLEREMREKEEHYKKQEQQSDARIICLDSLNRDLQEKNRKQEEKLKELRGRIHSAEQELNKAKESLLASNEQNERLHSETKSKDLKMTHQKEQIEQLEHDVSVEKQRIRKLQEQLADYPRKLERLDEELYKTNDLLKKEKRISEHLEEDVTKGNQVIEKLQREIQSSHEKMKNCHKVISKLENDILEKENFIQNLKEELNNTKIELKKSVYEVKALTNVETHLKDEVISLQKELKGRNSVIDFLQNEMTKHCIVPQYVPPAHLSNPAALKVKAIGDHIAPIANKSSTAVSSTRKISKLDYPYIANGTNTTVKSPIPRTAVDSAYSTAPSPNTRSTNHIGNANVQSNLEIDSNVLSAAFKNDQISKHSTAKKQTYTSTKSKNRKS